jgi:hypothetical protein
LNALHSQSVDGAAVKIPDRLTTPPEPQDPYIIDLLEEQASGFAALFLSQRKSISGPTNTRDAEILVMELLKSRQRAISEYELFQLAYRISKDAKFSLLPYLQYLDFSALRAQEKYAICTCLEIDGTTLPEMWNSLLRSDLLSREDFYARNLDQPFSLQRLYSSKINGLYTFFTFLRMTTQDFVRKIILLKVRPTRTADSH